MPSRKKTSPRPLPCWTGEHSFSSPRIRTAWGTPLPLTRCVWCGLPKSPYREPVSPAGRKGDAA